MKRDHNGNIVGDKFVFTREGATQLSLWFDDDSLTTLGGGNVAEIDLGPVTLDDLRAALRHVGGALPTSF